MDKREYIDKDMRTLQTCWREVSHLEGKLRDQALDLDRTRPGPLVGEGAKMQRLEKQICGLIEVLDL